tara:strand:+ start:314 stop:712 length:399 start_codon:yes stop_codon:yes gene_type:complete
MIQFYGVKAQVYLKYEGDIENLSQKISLGMILPNFSFDTDMEPPHEVFGYCEALGFEICLRKYMESKDYTYSLTLETELSIKESFNGQMHDISPWLARFISKICEIESCIEIKNEKFSFINGQVNHPSRSLK